MNKRIIIDTNIWIYYLDINSIFYNVCKEKIMELKKNEFNIYITSQIFREILVVLTKNKNIIRNVKINKVIEKINYLFEDVEILFENKKSVEIFNELLIKYEISGLKIHDANIVSVALENNINTILTHNIKDFEYIKEINIIGLNDE